MNYNIRFNIKGIILFENLTGTPFPNFSNENSTQILQLLYCLILANNDIQMTYKEFCSLMENEKIAGDISRRFEKICKVSEQFKQTISQGSNRKKEQEKTASYVKDIIPLLLDCGLSIEYIMKDLDYVDIPVYLDYKNEKDKSSLEIQRMWTYYTILPHIDGKKIKSPMEMCSFPWEQETLKKEAIAFADRAQKFLNNLQNKKQYG